MSYDDRTAKTRRLAGGLILSAMACMWSGTAAAQGGPGYEPSYRQKLRAESCGKTETAEGPYCIKRCDPDFKLEMRATKPFCRATSGSAQRKPVAVEYQPPVAQSNAKPVAGY